MNGVSLYALLQRLEAAKIHYTLGRVRGGAIMVKVSVPGRRYEIEVFSDGSVEVEIFAGDGHIGGAELLTELFEKYPDSD